MSGKTIVYAWKTVGDDAFSDKDAYLQALQQVIDQIQRLPPQAQLVTPVQVVDDGTVEDNDGSTVHVYHWEVTYAI